MCKLDMFIIAVGFLLRLPKNNSIFETHPIWHVVDAYPASMASKTKICSPDRRYEHSCFKIYNGPYICIPGFLKTGLAKIRTHSTTWQ